jgi:general secretion pathway protein I
MSWWTGSPAALLSRNSAVGEGGFTLLEVLVAFAIMAVAMVAVMQAFGGGLDATRRTEAASGALATARSLMDRVGTELPVTPGTLTGGSVPGPRWTVQIARRKSPLDDLPKPERRYALYDVVVSVTLPGTAPVTLSTVQMAAVR